jgi:transposase InsO family protein
VVIDAYSRQVVGWASDARQRADLATDSLGMWRSTPALRHRAPSIHGDHGPQFTSWRFTERARRPRLLPSLGTVGDPYDNAVAESFWGTMPDRAAEQTTLEHPRRARERFFQYIEGFHTRRRCHSALGRAAPRECENTTRQQPTARHR